MDTEEVDVEEKVVTMGRRRRMRSWSTRSPSKNHCFFNMSLLFLNGIVKVDGCSVHESCDNNDEGEKRRK